MTSIAPALARLNPRSLLPLILFSLLLVPGCGGNGGTDPDPEPTPTISIAVSPASITLDQGTPLAADEAPTEGEVTVTLTRGGGYTGSVTVSLEGAPTGVFASPITIGSGSTTGTLTLFVNSEADPGTTSLTVRASGPGVTDATAALSLTVEEVLLPGFTFTVNPASTTIQQGTSGTVTLNVTRHNGFTGAVAFLATGQPAGMTVGFTPASVSGNSTEMTISVGVGVPPGTYTFTLTGSGDVAVYPTATLSVEVTPGGGAGEFISLLFCDQTGIPSWVAAKDGDGPWVEVPIKAAVSGGSGPSGVATVGVWEFTITEAKGSLAYVIEKEGAAHLEVFHAAAAELGYQGEDHCTGAMEVKTASGTVAGVGPMDIAGVSMGGATASVAGGSGVFTYDLAGIRDGPVDLVATNSLMVADASGFYLDPQKMIIRRDLNPTSPYAVPILDFGAAEAFIPSIHALTIHNLDTHKAIVSGAYQTGNGSVSSFFTSFEARNQMTRLFPGVPAAQQAVGDFHTLTVSSFDDSVNPPDKHRGAMLVFDDAADQSVNLGPLMTGPDITHSIKVPYVRFRVRVPYQAEYDDFVSAHFDQTDGRRNSAAMSATGSYLSGADFDFRIPDFSGLPGWNNDWGIEAGLVGLTNVNLFAFGWNVPGGITGVPFTNGAVSRWAGFGTAFVP